jgi:hypothetical protein
MLAKGAIDCIVPWENFRMYLYARLRWRLAEEVRVAAPCSRHDGVLTFDGQAVLKRLRAADASLPRSEAVALVRQWLQEAGVPSPDAPAQQTAAAAAADDVAASSPTASHLAAATAAIASADWLEQHGDAVNAHIARVDARCVSCDVNASGLACVN